MKPLIVAALSRKAGNIAGCCWDDREPVGTLAEQLRRVAWSPKWGSDGDLTAEDRRALLALADLADRCNS